MSDTPSNNTNTPWFAVSVGLMGLIVGYGLSGLTGGTTAQVAPTQVVADAPAPAAPSAPAPAGDPPSIDDDAVLGDEDAPVTIVEFTDYQCPFCQRHYEQTYGQIKSQYVDTGKVKLVVRDYPLSFHPNAQPAAEAAECAGDQDKYFEMHDKLFGGLSAWGNLPDAKPTFEQYAQEIGLDVADYKDCVAKGTHTQEVQQDMADGSAAGISGTPGFWVIGPDGKGEMISGAQPFTNFQATIDKYLN